MALWALADLAVAVESDTQRRPIAVLLTDGNPNGVPPHREGGVDGTVLNAASAVHATGARLYAIGFGTSDRVNHDLLGRMLRSQDHYFTADDTETLASALEAIVQSEGCP